MNTITAKINTGGLENYPAFLAIQIDGLWLDSFVANLQPGSDAKGAIATLAAGMDRESEEEIVWQRFLPAENCTACCPVLMCPDDCDFYCTCIVAEIHNNGTTVTWSRLGADKSDVKDAEQVGSQVNWYHNFEKLEFNLSDYKAVFNAFKQLRLKAEKGSGENNF